MLYSSGQWEEFINEWAYDERNNTSRLSDLLELAIRALTSAVSQTKTA